MKKKPKIEVPNVRDPQANTGLFLRGNVWYYRYTLDGVRKQESTGHTGVGMARKFRDGIYENMLINGATVAARKKIDNAKRVQRAKADPDAYIHKREPYMVKIGTVIVAECSTKKAAKEARDQYLAGA